MSRISPRASACAASSWPRIRRCCSSPIIAPGIVMCWRDVRSSIELHNTVHLDARAFRQRRHANGGTGRVGLLEITRHHLVDQRKVREVGEEDIQLGKLLQRTAGGVTHRAEVIEHAY